MSSRNDPDESLAELRQLVRQGLDSGLSDENLDAVFDRLIDGYKSMAKKAKSQWVLDQR